jgi:hypothetical protein
MSNGYDNITENDIILSVACPCSGQTSRIWWYTVAKLTVTELDWTGPKSQTPDQISPTSPGLCDVPCPTSAWSFYIHPNVHVFVVGTTLLPLLSLKVKPLALSGNKRIRIHRYQSCRVILGILYQR